MIIRATSDLHLTQRTAPWVFEALEQLRADDEKHGGTTVLVGDILDQANTVHMPTFNRLRDVLESFKGCVIVVAGNHDQYGHEGRNALESLHGHSNPHSIRVVSEPTVTGVGLMIPYTQPDQFWSAVDKAKAEAATMKDGDKIKVWWTHQGWRGSYLNNMRRDRDGLSCRRVDAQLVVSGHYHLPQNLGPIIYCGSPYETSFAEEGQAKGWLRWEVSNHREFVENPQVPDRVAYNLTAPRHWTVLWDLTGEEPKAPKHMKDGDKVRVIVNGTRDEVKKRSKVLKKAGLEGAAIVADVSGSRRRVIDRNTTAQEAVVQFIDRIYGPDEERIHPGNLHLWADEVGLWQS